jgi:hypothetical protein
MIAHFIRPRMSEGHGNCQVASDSMPLPSILELMRPVLEAHKEGAGACQVE